MKIFYFAAVLILIFSYMLQAQNADNALPVELVYFYAEKQNDYITLYWGTATELNNYGFIPQRSVNDSTSFVDIGFVFGHGTTYSPKDYSFADTTAVDSGRLFYRLKQLDTNGDFKYSWVVEPDSVTSVKSVAAEFEERVSISVYPNPFNSLTSVMFSLREEGYVNLYIVDILGRRTTELYVGEIEKGNHRIIIDGSRLASGIYFVILRTRLETVSRKILNLK